MNLKIHQKLYYFVLCVEENWMKKIDNFMKEKRMKLIELVCSCTNESSDYFVEVNKTIGIEEI